MSRKVLPVVFREISDRVVIDKRLAFCLKQYYIKNIPANLIERILCLRILKKF